MRVILPSSNGTVLSSKIREAGFFHWPRLLRMLSGARYYSVGFGARNSSRNLVTRTRTKETARSIHKSCPLSISSWSTEIERTRLGYQPKIVHPRTVRSARRIATISGRKSTAPNVLATDKERIIVHDSEIDLDVSTGGKERIGKAEIGDLVVVLRNNRTNLGFLISDRPLTALASNGYRLSCNERDILFRIPKDSLGSFSPPTPMSASSIGKVGMQLYKVEHKVRELGLKHFKKLSSMHEHFTRSKRKKVGIDEVREFLFLEDASLKSNSSLQTNASTTPEIPTELMYSLQTIAILLHVLKNESTKISLHTSDLSFTFTSPKELELLKWCQDVTRSRGESLNQFIGKCGEFMEVKTKIDKIVGKVMKSYLQHPMWVEVRREEGVVGLLDFLKANGSIEHEVICKLLKSLPKWNENDLRFINAIERYSEIEITSSSSIASIYSFVPTYILRGLGLGRFDRSGALEFLEILGIARYGQLDVDEVVGASVLDTRDKEMKDIVAAIVENVNSTDYTIGNGDVKSIRSSSKLVSATTTYPCDPHFHSRHDFGNLPVYTIDAPTAHEIDDGVSVESLSNGETWVHIHVASPTSYIPPQGRLESHTRKMSGTIYFPEESIPMLPGHLGRELGITEGKGNCVMSLSCLLGQNGSIKDYKVRPGFIRNVVKLSYDQVDTMLTSTSSTGLPRLPNLNDMFMHPPPISISINPRRNITSNILLDAQNYSLNQNDPIYPSSVAQDLQNLFILSQRHFEYRRGNAAFNIYQPSGSMSLSPYPFRSLRPADNKIQFSSLNLTPLVTLTPALSDMSASQRLVSELMILAGKLAAQFAFEHKIPVPYRVQDPLRPDIESLVTKFVNEKGVLPFPKSVDMISGLGSAGYSLYPGGHSQMGILDGEGYVKITSPLRRYLDTFVHWQFDCYFASQKNPGFDGAKYGLDKIVETAELRERLANITAHEKRLRLITRQRERFWYLWCLRERENQGKVMGMQERLSYTGVVGQMDKNDTAFTVRLWQGPVGKIYKNRTDGGKWNRLESGQWVQIEVDELDLWSGRLTWRLLEVL